MPGGRNMSIGKIYDRGNREVVQHREGVRLHRAGRRLEDAFVHISAVERAGLSSLSEGQKVSYELQPGQHGKSSAQNLSIIE